MAINPTQNGINPLRGLNYDPRLTDAENAEMDLRLKQLRKSVGRAKRGYSTAYTPEIDTFTESKHYEPGTPGFEKGMSRYDSKGDVLSPVTSFEDLNQRRYENQPWYDVAANGIAKAVGRAATSFITGVAGGVAGLADFAYEGLAKGEWNAARLIDNPLSNALADLDDWANENFVNYKSIIQKQNEENGEWYNNLGSLNMVMDDIVTNFGFIVGMGAAAAVTGGIGGAVAGAARRGAAGALRAARRSGNMAKLWGATKAAGIVHKYGYPTAKAVTLFNSSAGEAALEGLGVKREMMQEETQRINNTINQHIAEDPNIQALDSEYQAQMQMLEQQYYMRPKGVEYEQQKAAITQQYQQQRNALSQEWETRRQAALQEMDASAERAGMATALLNMAILVPSNFNMYGRMIDKAFRNAEKSAGKSWAVRNAEIHQRNSIGQRNITGDIKGKTWDQIRNAKKNYGSRTFLGNEANRVGSTMFSEGIYEEMGQSAASTGAKYYHEWANPDNYWRARLDPDSIDQVTDGSHNFLQALGQGFKETYGDIDGWREGFIGGITGGLFGGASIATEWRDTRAARRGAKDLNKQLQNDRLPNLLQHIVAQGFHDNVKQGYAAMNNQRDWKTEDDKAAYALVSSFARAGRMDDLHHLINSYTDQMSDDDIQSMIDAGTRRVSSQEQINQMKQEIRKNTSEKVEALLKDGASIDDYMRAQSSVQAAADAVTQAEQAVEAARQKAVDTSGDIRWMQKSESALRNQARSARRAQNKAIARDIVTAMDALEMAREKHRNAKSAVSAMMASPESQQGIDAALAEYEELNNRADNSAPDEYLEGPFVDNSGSNTMQIDEVREQLKHNQDRIQQVVDRYKNAVEKVNRDTRGTLSKDQEDYLAYTQFMAESSGVRAQELVQKWRGVLPEVVSIRHKSSKSAAKMFGIDEGEVVEDPDNPGFYRVSTKKMTDEQFANFVLHGLLKQSHVKSKNDTGDGSDTNNLRGSLADEALDAIDKDMKRTGRRDKFDRDELRRDFEDIEDHFKKNKAFADAYLDALSNPEGVMSAKQKFLRNLKKRYDKTKAKLRQKKMSIQELGDLSDDELKGLDNYHFALAKAERIRRRLKDYWDEKVPDIYDRIEEAFKGIADPDVREEIIDRIKDRIDTIISRLSSYDPETGPVDVDAEEISEMINLHDIFEDDDFFNNLDKKTKDIINTGLDELSSLLKNLIKISGNLTRNLRKFFDKLRGNTQENTASDPQSLFDKITGIIGKAVTSATDIEELKNLKKSVQERIAELSSEGGPSTRAIIKMLRGLLDKINDFVSSSHKKNSPDSAPDDTGTPAYGQPSAKGARRSSNAAPAPSIETEDVQQNPDQSEEEEEVDRAADASLYDHININGISGFFNPWQTVTQEFARRSNFTYKTYHEIVTAELEKWDREHPEPNEDAEMEIDALKPYGYKHKVSKWRRLAERSKIVYDRIKDNFGFIDEGNVKAGDDIRFLVTKDPNIGTIIYLVHEDKDGHRTVIGDLTEPDPEVNASTDPDLSRLWTELEKELDASGEAEILSEKFKTHVGNVYSGFVKYRGTDAAGRRQYSPVAGLDGSDDIEFHIAGTSAMYDDIYGSAKRGQPVVIIKRPGNLGKTRRAAIPVITTPFNSDGVEAKVISQAAKNLNEDELKVFLKDFLHCSQVFITSSQVRNVDTGDPVTMYTVEVRTRNTVAKTKGKAAAGEHIKQEFRVMSDGTVAMKDGMILRANVSKRLMNNYLYKKAVSGAEDIPENYTDFLKQVCQAPVEDFNIHNSWVTVNPISIKDDDTINERDTTEFTDKKSININGNVEVTINDPVNNLVYIVEFDAKSNVPTVLSIRGGSQQSRLPIINVKGANKGDMLEKMAIAASKMLNSAEYDSTNSFMFQGLKYEYYLERSGEVNDIAIAEDQPSPNKSALCAAVKNELSYIARHYNGRNIDAIITEFFDTRSFNNNPTMVRNLETLLKEMKDGKTTYSPAFSALATIVNAHKPITQRAYNVADGLIRHLKNHGITIIDDVSIGQERRNRAQERLNNDGVDALRESEDDDNVSYFLDPSGQIVYGFADHTANTPTIYLDKDLINPETTIHEYTHLWIRCLRKINPDVWSALVDELEKKYSRVWNQVIRAYGSKVYLKSGELNRNKVADEVFAHITGDKYAKEFLENIGMSKAETSSLVGSLKKIYNKFINAVRAIFNKPLAETMQELVIEDMLSDNPLHNFGILDQVAEHYGIGEKATFVNEEQNNEEAAAEPAQKSSGKTTIGPEDVSIDQLQNGYDRLSENGISFDFDPISFTFTFTTVEDRDKAMSLFDDTISSHISITEHSPIVSQKAAEAFDVLGETFIENMKYLFNRGFGFDGIAPHIDRMNYWLRKGRMNSEDFVRSVELLLSDKERNDLWEASVEEVGKDTVTNSAMVAQINNMFNSRLQGKSFDNPVLNTLFDALADKVRNLERNKDVVERTENAFTEIASGTRTSTPTDPISSLSESDRDYAYRESIMLLTEKDVRVLSSAGFSESMYKASSNDVKEWFRECVI